MLCFLINLSHTVPDVILHPLWVPSTYYDKEQVKNEYVTELLSETYCAFHRKCCTFEASHFRDITGKCTLLSKKVISAAFTNLAFPNTLILVLHSNVFSSQNG